MRDKAKEILLKHLIRKGASERMIRFQKLVDRDKNIDAMIEFAQWYYNERQTYTEANNHPDTKQLIIGDVSKQRELLNDFLVKLRRLLNFTHSRPLPKYVEFYLKGIL